MKVLLLQDPVWQLDGYDPSLEPMAETGLITNAAAHIYRSALVLRWLIQFYPVLAAQWADAYIAFLHPGGISFGADICSDGDRGHFSFAIANHVGYIHEDGLIEGLY